MRNIAIFKLISYNNYYEDCDLRDCDMIQGCKFEEIDENLYDELVKLIDINNSKNRFKNIKWIIVEQIFRNNSKEFNELYEEFKEEKSKIIKIQEANLEKQRKTAETKRLKKEQKEREKLEELKMKYEGEVGKNV